MKIVFIGMMGSGKSVVGKKVAEILGLDFVDTDSYIERRHGSIEEMFKTLGEEHFREVEKNAIAEIAALDNVVISTGGGAVLNTENVKELKSNSAVFFLQADAETVYERTKNSNRPLLKNGGLARIKEILEIRQKIYKSCADVTVSTDNLSVEQLALQIADIAKSILN